MKMMKRSLKKKNKRLLKMSKKKLRRRENLLMPWISSLKRVLLLSQWLLKFWRRQKHLEIVMLFRI